MLNPAQLAWAEMQSAVFLRTAGGSQALESSNQGVYSVLRSVNCYCL